MSVAFVGGDDITKYPVDDLKKDDHRQGTLVGFDLDIYSEKMTEKVAPSKGRNKASEAGWIGAQKPRSSSDEFMRFEADEDLA